MLTLTDAEGLTEPLGLKEADGEMLVLADGLKEAECSSFNLIAMAMILRRRLWEYWDSPAT